MKRTIKLNGQLGKLFGKTFKLAVKTPAEAIRAISVLRPGFKEYLQNANADGVQFRVMVGNNILRGTQDDFALARGASETIRIITVPSGRKSGGGIWGIIAGVVIIAVSWWNPLGWSAGVAVAVGSFGAGLALSGTAQLLSRQKKIDGPAERPENTPSDLFNGPVNTTQQGQCVPLLYGELIVGSAVVSASLTTSEVPV